MSNEVNQAFLRAYVKNRAERALQGTSPSTDSSNPSTNPPAVVLRNTPKPGESIRIDPSAPPISNSPGQPTIAKARAVPAPYLNHAGSNQTGSNHAPSKQRAPELNRTASELPQPEHQGGVWSPIGVERGMKGANRSTSAPAIVVNAPRLDSMPNVARVGSRTVASQSPTSTTPTNIVQAPAALATSNTKSTSDSLTRLRIDAAHGLHRPPHTSEIYVSQTVGDSIQVAPSIVVNDHLQSLREQTQSRSVVPNAPIMAGAGIVTPRSDFPSIAARTTPDLATTSNMPTASTKLAGAVSTTLPKSTELPRGTDYRTGEKSGFTARPMPQHGDIHTAENMPPEPITSSARMDRHATDYSPIDRHADRTSADRGSADRGSSTASLPLPVAFSPSWEVDRFVWPAVLLQIEKSDAAAFQAISKHLRLANQDGLKVIAVTSGERGVGRSTVAMHLARSAAASGLKVALVDADGFYPSLIDQLKLDLDHGWQECLFENIPLEEVAVKSLEDNITLFPLSAVIPTQQLHVNLHRMAKIVKRISLAYDMVFLDSNRLNLEQRDLIGISQDRIIDAAIVVTDSELSVKEKVDTAVSILHGMGIASVGIVQNFHS